MLSRTPSKIHLSSVVISTGFPTPTDSRVVSDQSWWWEMTQFHNIWSYSIFLWYNSILSQVEWSSREMFSHSLKRLSFWLSLRYCFLDRRKIETYIWGPNYEMKTFSLLPSPKGETILKTYTFSPKNVNDCKWIWTLL